MPTPPVIPEPASGPPPNTLEHLPGDGASSRPEAVTPRPGRARRCATCGATRAPARQAAHTPAHGPAQTPARGSAGPLLARDRVILIWLAKMRLLTFPQLGALAFPGLHRARASYRVQSLVRAGWLRTWEDRAVIGGRPRYLLPTTSGLRWALRRLTEHQSSASSAPLLRTMLKSDRQLPVPLRDGVTPPFLAHLREVNDLLTGVQSCPALDVTWVSSWHRPFPNAESGLPLPQPDFIVVVKQSDARFLVFGEHDRGNEPLGRFREAKVQRYRALADRPELVRALTGFHAFRVVVTVRDASGGNDASRIAALTQTVREGYAARFTSVIRADDLLHDPALLLQTTT